QPWIPPAADAVLRRALAKEPTARYASCTEPIRLLTIALEDATPAAPHLMPWQPLLAAALSRYRRLRTRHP
ncbi:MAG: hypothetical protein HOQ24_01720, partial [Mycobacteriaceae bacterium]|nr:hypothetical protein [Mycobacteriaceae bacterium]